MSRLSRRRDPSSERWVLSLQPWQWQLLDCLDGSRLAITAIEGPRTTVRSLSIWPLASSHTPHLTHFKLPLDPASRPGVRPTIISSISSVQHKIHSWFYWFFVVKSINYHQLVVSNVSKWYVDVNIQHTNVHIGIRLTFRSIINELYNPPSEAWASWV